MHERDRLLAAIPAQPGVEVGTILPELRSIQYLRFDALAIQNCFEKSSGENLVPGGLVVLMRK
jgi:hypothetical protein